MIIQNRICIHNRATYTIMRCPMPRQSTSGQYKSRSRYRPHDILSHGDDERLLVDERLPEALSASRDPSHVEREMRLAHHAKGRQG
ncbi:hypothetical protein BD626DRAFT_512286 [Schizophyllum amplum]|uniref:Uncharacterized protein n=1 Tax=Schizophyllum amplum TaxID=97359 RepID=A0A550C036_9AGAR|nr:hypothetical protein BD626DRAFT_512286 [Auriculariopsis ampla]